VFIVAHTTHQPSTLFIFHPQQAKIQWTASPPLNQQYPGYPSHLWIYRTPLDFGSGPFRFLLPVSVTSLLVLLVHVCVPHTRTDRHLSNLRFFVRPSVFLPRVSVVSHIYQSSVLPPSPQCLNPLTVIHSTAFHYITSSHRTRVSVEITSGNLRTLGTPPSAVFRFVSFCENLCCVCVCGSDDFPLTRPPARASLASCLLPHSCLYPLSSIVDCRLIDCS
jgi:hypothetical protein